MKGCIKELKRLRKHYKEEYDKIKHSYSAGVYDGLDMAINIIENKKFYGD
jgi:hypothetical protein